MWQRLTADARNVVFEALDDARSIGSQAVGPELMLRAALLHAGGASATILTKTDTDVAGLLAFLDGKVVSNGDTTSSRTTLMPSGQTGDRQGL